MNRDQLLARLKSAAHENLRLHPYVDTEGKTTIGIGRNLTDDGITVDEAEAMCLRDIGAAEADLDFHIPWWRNLSEVRQQVVAELCFWMGWGDGTDGLSSFHHMLGYLQVGNTTGAAEELLNSTIGRKETARTRLLAAALRTNSF